MAFRVPEEKETKKTEKEHERGQQRKTGKKCQYNKKSKGRDDKFPPFLCD
jgi:hypothetical protein